MKNWKSWLLLVSNFAGAFMGNVAAGTPPATLVSEAELRACGHGKEREIAGPSASNPSIKLISISPADSSYVSRDSTVVAELEYSIDRFEPGMYQLNAQFETTDPHATTGGRLQEQPELQYAHGALRFCYPLHGIWSSPQVNFPLAMKFYLTKRNEDGSTQVIAQSPITHFNAADLPATALGGAAPTADQLAMREAVQTVASMLEAVELQVQLCAEAFPDMKSSLMPPLEAWQKQYSKLKKKSDALYLDMIRQRIPGISKDGVLVYLEGQHTAIRQQIASVPGAVSENNCAQMPGRFADGAFDPAQRIPEAYQRVSAQLSP
jgi:hypothetical protein